ncbi:MAG: HAD family hydrolase [Treponema sp.]|nr:HAD family hydrolase [Treponema sp.]
MQTEQPGYNGMKRSEAYYRPMAEIVDYLTQNQFTVYISTGTNRYTLRPLAMEIFKLPPHQIIGSDSLIVCRDVREIGYQPVLAFGNSLTDASMLNFAIHGNKYKSLGFMLCCDDLERDTLEEYKKSADN